MSPADPTAVVAVPAAAAADACAVPNTPKALDAPPSTLDSFVYTEIPPLIVLITGPAATASPANLTIFCAVSESMPSMTSVKSSTFSWTSGRISSPMSSSVSPSGSRESINCLANDIARVEKDSFIRSPARSVAPSTSSRPPCTPDKDRITVSPRSSHMVPNRFTPAMFRCTGSSMLASPFKVS